MMVIYTHKMDLLTFIKNNENSRKIFGNRELKIIEKQLLGVDLTQSEKNRLSRDIRKKLDVISGLVRFESEFKLKKSANITRLIDEAKQVILNNPSFNKIKKIILYGSTAENKRTLRSDIDLAVVFDKIDVKEATVFRKNVLGRVSEKIDIQVFNILPDKIKHEIEKKGKVLYEQKQNRG
jgi:predicted nucleotidyltransferase